MVAFRSEAEFLKQNPRLLLIESKSILSPFYAFFAGHPSEQAGENRGLNCAKACEV
jgi:hypothetical protein